MIINPLTNTAPDFHTKVLKSASNGTPLKKSIIFPVMSELKTLTLVATVISIFAVDFHDYPRRFCKTHMLGISLMDIGTGALMFISGLTSRHFIHQEKGALQRVWMNIRAMPFLFLIAFAGVLTRWLANHPEVVTEYGVHWNFFWTVCFITMFSSFIQNFRHALINGMIMIVAYQIFLYYGATDFVFYAPRTNFVSKNKEGFFGCLGYCCTYLLGMGLSAHIFKRDKIELGQVINSRRVVIIKNLVFSLSFFLIGFICELYIQPISRRLVNMAYVMYISGNTVLCSWLMYTLDSCLVKR